MRIPPLITVALTALALSCAGGSESDSQPFAALEAFVNADGVSLRWQPAQAKQVSRYAVERGAGEAAELDHLAETTQLLFVDSTVLPATTYTYRVAALRADDSVVAHTTRVTVTTAAPVTAVQPVVGVDAVTLRWHLPDISINDVAWNQTDTQLAGTSDGSVARFLDAESGMQAFTVFVGQFTGFMGWRRDTGVFAFGGFNQVELFSAETGAEEDKIEDLFGFVNALDWNGDGTQLAIGGGSSLFVWDVAGSEVVVQRSPHDDDIQAVSWQPDLDMVAVLDDSGRVVVWDSVAWSPVTTLEHFTGAGSTLRWLDADPVRLAVGFADLDASTRIYRSDTWQALAPVVAGGEINFDGSLVAVADPSRRVLLYDYVSNAVVFEFSIDGFTATNVLTQLDWASSRHVLAVSGNGTSVWELALTP